MQTEKWPQVLNKFSINLAEKRKCSISHDKHTKKEYLEYFQTPVFWQSLEWKSTGLWNLTKILFLSQKIKITRSDFAMTTHHILDLNTGTTSKIINQSNEIRNLKTTYRWSGIPNQSRKEESLNTVQTNQLKDIRLGEHHTKQVTSNA